MVDDLGIGDLGCYGNTTLRFVNMFDTFLCMTSGHINCKKYILVMALFGPYVTWHSMRQWKNVATAFKTNSPDEIVKQI